MAAIVTDDEADVHECCEWFPHPFVATCVCHITYQAQSCRSDAARILCSKLRGDKRPLEVQSLPERLVLLCAVPKGEEIHNVIAPIIMTVAVFSEGMSMSC